MDKPSFCPFHTKDCPAINEKADWNCPLAIKRIPEAKMTCSFFELATQLMRLGDYVYDITNKLKSAQNFSRKSELQSFINSTRFYRDERTQTQKCLY